MDGRSSQIQTNGTVYLIGAGANRVITDSDGQSPPLIDDFFQVASQMRKFSDSFYVERLAPVYEYIYQFWKKKIMDLASSSFDLEECFTLLEFQLKDAIGANDLETARRLWGIEFKLKSFIAELLSEFQLSAYQSNEMRRFGEILFQEKPTILTFNYDCILEAAIEGASRVKAEPYPRSTLSSGNATPSGDELAHSHFNWNRPLAYGILFDKVQLQRAGLPQFADGKMFYAHPRNQVYSWNLLKLHGSLNWFRYLPLRVVPEFIPGEPAVPALGEKENHVILTDGHWWFNQPPDLDGWIIDPLLITPVLYKEAFFQEPVYARVFSPLWNRAREALSGCKRLVTVGYSFPPTDFSTKRLFLEAFKQTTPEELIVVNPNSSVADKVQDLCHNPKSVKRFAGLKEFLHMSETADRTYP